MRERKRYLAFEVLGLSGLSFSDVRGAIISSAHSFFGLSGLSKSSLVVMSDFWDSKTGRGVLRVNRGSLDDVKSSLLMVSNINNEDCSIRSVLVSGSLKSLKSKLSEVRV